MFNFQKEVVINSNKQYTTVTAPSKGAPTETGTQFPIKFRVHGGGEYFGKYIVDSKAYFTDPISGKNFKLTIEVPEEDVNKHVQILIELGLDNDYRGDYGSALWYFRKPILVDVVLGATANESAKIIYNAIKAAIPQEYKFVTLDPYTDGNKVVLNGADSYQKVIKAVVTEFYCEDRCAGNGSEELRVITEKQTPELISAEDGWFLYEANNVEFGTYDYLIHNLRLPTYENFRFTSPAAVEMPLKGHEYSQFSFAYCVPRTGLGGLSAVGQTVHSTTLHTFYVESSLAEDFKTKLESLGITCEEICREGDHTVTALPDTFASTQDLAAATGVAANADAINTNEEADQALEMRVAQVESKNTEQDNTISTKANASDVYTKTEADNRFQKKA